MLCVMTDMEGNGDKQTWIAFAHPCTATQHCCVLRVFSPPPPVQSAWQFPVSSAVNMWQAFSQAAGPIPNSTPKIPGSMRRPWCLVDNSHTSTVNVRLLSLFEHPSLSTVVGQLPTSAQLSNWLSIGVDKCACLLHPRQTTPNLQLPRQDPCRLLGQVQRRDRAALLQGGASARMHGQGSVWQIWAGACCPGTFNPKP